MPSETPGRERAEHGPSAGGGAPAAGEHIPARATERVGPLAVSRNVKADGRRLLLFSRVERALGTASDGAGGEAAAPDATEAERGAGARGAGARGTRAVSELRFDELRGEEVVYAIHRQDRTFLPARDHCPLDPTSPGGPETEIPFPAFELAVFDNRFPAFEEPLGAAEVVVYTERHDGSFGGLAPERAEALMWVWRHRYAELGAREDIDYVMIFENRGVEVGVTLHHPHGQIYGFPFLPPVPKLELRASERLGGCATCVLAARELDDGSRIVHESDAVLAYVPYAGRWAYEVHVTMRAHRASLLQCEPRELSELAAALQAVTRGYDALFERPFPYVMVVHQAPSASRARDAEATDHTAGHLHVEFYPPLRTAEKLKYLAGSEQGAGTFISDTLPEESAAALREAIARAA